MTNNVSKAGDYNILLLNHSTLKFNHMKCVMIETPLMARGERTMEDNLKYAKECMKDSVKKGEAPFAMHVLYTQVLDDNKYEERWQGILSGLAWSRRADAIVFYMDYGMSTGMNLAYEQAQLMGIKVEYRTLYTPTEAATEPLVGP